jgi:MFS family permease
LSRSPKGLAVLWVLRHPALLRLWLAQIIYLSVQFTASYAMIVLVTDETHSATLVGLVIIALSLPLVLLGAPAGALVDQLDRRSILWISNVVRAVSTALFVVVLLLDPHQFWFIYVLAFVFSLVGMFFSPAEGAIIPQLVGEAELLSALSLYNLTLNVSQAVGLLVLGPLTLDLLPSVVIGAGPHAFIFTPVETLFTLLTLLYLVAAALTASLPRQQKPESPLAVSLLDDGIAYTDTPPALVAVQAISAQAKESVHIWHRLREDVLEGWQLVRGNALLLDGLWQSCFGGLVMLTIAELATTFVQRLLNLPTSDTALIFAPAGIGLVGGALLVPWVVSRLKTTGTIISGLVGTALGIGLLPIAQRLAALLDPADWWLNPFFLSSIAILTALVGLSLDLVVVPAQTRMQEQSPDALRGRILAFYQVLFNGGAIPVVLFMGALADLFGIGTVINVLVALNLGAALVTLLRVRSRNTRGPGGHSPDRIRRSVPIGQTGAQGVSGPMATHEQQATLSAPE